MYSVMYNSIVQAKVPKIIMPIKQQGQNGTTIFNILDNTTELWMTKYIIGEIFSSGGATLYKDPPDQTVRNR